MCGDNAQPGVRVEEEQEVDDVQCHGEVAQDEVEGAVRGGVKGLAGVEGEDVVGPSPLELPLRHEQRGACVGAREGPLLPVADHSVPCEHFRDALGEGAREQLHVQLAQGYWQSSSLAEPGTLVLSQMCAPLRCIGGGAPRRMAR